MKHFAELPAAKDLEIALARLTQQARAENLPPPDGEVKVFSAGYEVTVRFSWAPSITTASA